jgi:hypothetical protein
MARATHGCDKNCKHASIHREILSRHESKKLKKDLETPMAERQPDYELDLNPVRSDQV